MTGVLTMSVEVELGWGVHDMPKDDHLSDDGTPERAYLERLLSATERCGVPMSFDIVGHLLLDRCRGTHEGPYEPGWYDADPGTGVEEDPLFYAPDMADRILASRVDHELCTHTFSHLLCRRAAEGLVDVELERVQDLHGALDGPVTSFVPPRHSQPENHVLRRNGIRTARYAKTRESSSRLGRFWELTAAPHPQWEPRVVDGVLETYCTTYPSLTARSLPVGQRERSHPAFRPFPLDLRKRVHLFYLIRSTRRAIESGTALHLWCHLFDLSNAHQFEVLDAYLEYLSTVPEDELRIRTMRDLPEELVVE
ncbi:polysaccharide deacetylase [Halomarina salina]|uniref:Polysaccharide deacetylase n=1 Tax=Halomarina salina TaxID=1872699 RepID=A0ABD5RNJ7_9EURY|nr:hypothetical protein [Halomarina salina]